jgi:nicotinate-nucleotide adenylyltransferase
MNDILLYFGSFNPIHNGHTALARYVLETGVCSELWFVVSPRNPLKDNAELAPDTDRLEMARIAVTETMQGLNARVSDVEFGLPKPSYTIDTVTYLEQMYPNAHFSILAGADIMEQIEKWRSFEILMRKCPFVIYPRDGYSLGKYADKVTYLSDAPRWDYSSTDVRRTLHDGGDVSSMVTAGVLNYIKEKGLWL